MLEISEREGSTESTEERRCIYRLDRNELSGGGGKNVDEGRLNDACPLQNAERSGHPRGPSALNKLSPAAGGETKLRTARHRAAIDDRRAELSCACT